jgi:hypothetical protein
MEVDEHTCTARSVLQAQSGESLNGERQAGAKAPSVHIKLNYCVRYPAFIWPSIVTTQAVTC